jgi:agmatinase
MRSTQHNGFLDLPGELQDPARAGVHVLPIPYEATVSYETGTRGGPDAILRASHEVELYDAELDSEPCLSWGVHTLPALKADWRAPESMVSAVADAAEAVMRSSALPLFLGGEHSISPALVRGVRRVVNEPLTVVQIDAHADLRDSFRGTRYSHGCAMRRILEENPGPTVQIGIRSYSMEEATFIRQNTGRVTLWPMSRIHEEDPRDFLRQIGALVVGRRVYLTIDVDGLDPSVIPATGTPEPDGLGFRQASEIIRTVTTMGNVIAVDCVELAPRPGLHTSEFSVAKLLYMTVASIMARRSRS